MISRAGCLFIATLITGVLGERRQQFFRTTPGASFVSEGGRAILTCVIGDLGGRVQWTKDGLTLGYYRDLPGFPRYSVLGSDESGVFNLQIVDATLEDEATYECQVGPNGTNKPIRANAKLNVLLPPTKAELVGYEVDEELVVREEEEVGAHRWMNPADYMLKKRE